MAVTYLNFAADLHIVFLWDGIRNNNAFKRWFIDVGQRRSRQNTMRADGVDLQRSSLQKSMQQNRKYLVQDLDV